MSETDHEKWSLLQGKFPYFDDEQAEVLVKKLSLAEIRSLLTYCEASRKETLMDFSRYILSQATLKKRMELLNKEAKENE